MMLGDPVALVAKAIGESRQLNSVVKRVGGSEAVRNRALVDDREFHGNTYSVILLGYVERFQSGPSPVILRERLGEGSANTSAQLASAFFSVVFHCVIPSVAEGPRIFLDAGGTRPQSWNSLIAREMKSTICGVRTDCGAPPA